MRAYTDDYLEQLRTDGYYELTQRQRGMEREVRQTKRTLTACREAERAAQAKGDSELAASLHEDFTKHSARLKRQERKLREFCRENGLLEQSERVQVLGFDRSTAQRAVQAEKKLLQAKAKRDIIIREERTRKFLEDLRVGKIRRSIRDQKQLEHTPSAKWRKRVAESIENGNNPPSVFNRNISLEELAGLSGTGTIFFPADSRQYPIEYIDTPFVVGRTYDKKVQKYTSTRRFAIVYSNKGIHMYPVQEVTDIENRT